MRLKSENTRLKSENMQLRSKHTVLPGANVLRRLARVTFHSGQCSHVFAGSAELDASLVEDVEEAEEEEEAEGEEGEDTDRLIG